MCISRTKYTPKKLLIESYRDHKNHSFIFFLEDIHVSALQKETYSVAFSISLTSNDLLRIGKISAIYILQIFIRNDETIASTVV